MLRYIFILSASLSIPQKNLSIGVNVVWDGSSSRILIVLRISFGITTLPRSSILRTIPVAFIYTKSPSQHRRGELRSPAGVHRTPLQLEDVIKKQNEIRKKLLDELPDFSWKE